jgi:tripartite ATP-independent transporter DctP family solute receptor
MTHTIQTTTNPNLATDGQLRRRTAGVLAAVVLVLGISATTSTFAQDIKPRVIRFGFGNPESSPSGQGVKQFAALVEKKSGGKMKVRLFGDAQLGADMAMQNSLAAGSQEMMVGSTATLVGMVKEFGILDLPFVFQKPEEAYAVIDGPIGQKLTARLPEKGLVGIAFWDNGFRNMTNSKRAIAKMEDMNGIKLRVMQNPVYMEFFKDLGANPVPMPWSEVFGALETRAVDGQENPAPTINTAKLYEVQKHMSITRHAYAAHLVMASKKWWDSLSKDEQNVISESVIETRPYQRNLNNEADGKAIADLKTKGMTVTNISPAELQRMSDKVRPVVDKFAANIDPVLAKEMFTQIESMRKK